MPRGRFPLFLCELSGVAPGASQRDAVEGATLLPPFRRREILATGVSPFRPRTSLSRVPQGGGYVRDLASCARTSGITRCALRPRPLFRRAPGPDGAHWPAALLRLPDAQRCIQHRQRAGDRFFVGHSRETGCLGSALRAAPRGLGFREWIHGRVDGYSWEKRTLVAERYEKCEPRG